MSLEGDRRESTDEESPEHALMLRGSMRWRAPPGRERAGQGAGRRP